MRTQTCAIVFWVLLICSQIANAGQCWELVRPDNGTGNATVGGQKGLILWPNPAALGDCDTAGWTNPTGNGVAHIETVSYPATPIDFSIIGINQADILYVLSWGFGVVLFLWMFGFAIGSAVLAIRKVG